MDSDKILNTAINGFKHKFHEMCRNSGQSFNKIDSETLAAVTKILLAAAQESGKRGIGEYLNQHDIKKPSVQYNGSTYRYKGKSRDELLTLFGVIENTRSIYYNEKEGGDYHIPLDYSIGLEKNDFAVLDVREMILFGSASCIPAELSRLLSKCSLCTPSATAIQNIINKDGALMEELNDGLSSRVMERVEIPDHTQTLVASLDGANVLLREPGEKKGRKNIRPIENDTKADSTTSYHNAMVGAVSFYGTGVNNEPQRHSSIYTARMPEKKSVTFKEEFQRMLLSIEEKLADNRQAPTKVLLTDGHLMIKGFAKESPVLNAYEKLIDFFHTTEHLSKAAEVVYGEKTDCSTWWYTKWRTALKTDPKAPDAIVRSLQNFLRRHSLTGKRKNSLETEITFFTKNRHLMNYADFIQRGLPIGSGPIEAAAKTIVKQRMCRSGMRWSRTKGQYILTIKAYVQSGLWEKAWSELIKLKAVA